MDEQGQCISRCEQQVRTLVYFELSQSTWTNKVIALFSVNSMSEHLFIFQNISINIDEEGQCISQCGKHVKTLVYFKLFIVGLLLAHKRNAIKMAFCWWVDDGPLSVVFGFTLSLSLLIN